MLIAILIFNFFKFSNLSNTSHIFIEKKNSFSKTTYYLPLTLSTYNKYFNIHIFGIAKIRDKPHIKKISYLFYKLFSLNIFNIFKTSLFLLQLYHSFILALMCFSFDRVLHWPWEVEDSHQLPAHTLGLLESLREEDHLRDQFIVRLWHGHRPEQLLQVVRQLLTATVAFTSRVHGDEYTWIGIYIHLKFSKI